MKRRARAIWSGSGGRMVSNAHAVVKLVTRGAFRPDHVFWNVLSAGNKSVLHLALLCTERASPYQFGFGLRTW